MNISKSGIGAFDEILWYEGTSKLDGTSGQWILNHSQAFPEPMLQIDWTKAGTGIGILNIHISGRKKMTEPSIHLNQALLNMA